MSGYKYVIMNPSSDKFHGFFGSKDSVKRQLAHLLDTSDDPLVVYELRNGKKVVSRRGEILVQSY